MNLTEQAARRARRTQLDDPQDATVRADVVAATDEVRVRLGTGAGAYTAYMPWASNGLLPAAGDPATVLSTAAGRMALVWASGAPVA